MSLTDLQIVTFYVSKVPKTFKEKKKLQRKEHQETKLQIIIYETFHSNILFSFFLSVILWINASFLMTKWCNHNTSTSFAECCK